MGTVAATIAPWQNVSTVVTVSGRSPVQLDSVTRVRNSGLDFSGPLSKDLQLLEQRSNAQGGTVSFVSPAQIVSVRQNQIAQLKLQASDIGRFVYVIDYHHLLAWDGQSLSFADGGNNYCVFSDHGPPSASGWVPCQGQQVTYLLGNGGLGRKTLEPIARKPGFLQLGSGQGEYLPPVAPGIGGYTVPSVTGNGVTGTGVTGTGSVGGSASVGTSINGSSVSISGCTIGGNATSPSGIAIGGSITFGISHIGISGSATIASGVSLGGSIVFSIGTLFTAGAVGAGTLGVGGTATVATSLNGGLGAAGVTGTTTGDSGSVGGAVFGATLGILGGGSGAGHSVTAGVGSPFTASDGGDIDSATGALSLSGSVGSWGGGGSGGDWGGGTIGAGSFVVSYSSIASGLSLSSNSVNLSLTSITGSPTFTTMLSMNPSNLNSFILNTLVTPSLTVPSFGLYMDPSALNSAINLSALVTPSMTIPAAGLTFQGGSASISGMTLSSGVVDISLVTVPALTIPHLSIPALTIPSLTVVATSTDTGTPPAWEFQAWFRI